MILLSAGALVTSTSSGLSVPDWPSTYGENLFFFPIKKWVGGIFFEHGHRLIASFIGFLTIILSILIWKFEHRIWLKKLGFIALFLVIIQGIFGGITVLFYLPQFVSTVHATLAQTFFCVVVGITFFLSKNFNDKKNIEITNENKFKLKRISSLTTIFIFIQLIFGALLRHSKTFSQINFQNIFLYPHIFIASVVLFFVIKNFLTCRKLQDFKTYYYSKMILILVLVQIALGILTLIFRLETNNSLNWEWNVIIVTVVHLLLGALILATSLIQLLHTLHFHFNFFGKEIFFPANK